MKNRICEMVLLFVMVAVCRDSGAGSGCDPYRGRGACHVCGCRRSRAQTAFLGRARGTNLFPAQLGARLRRFRRRPAAQRAGPRPLLPDRTASSSWPAEPVPTATPMRATCWAATSKSSHSAKPSRAISFCFSRRRFPLAITCRSSSTPRRWLESRLSARSASASSCRKISRLRVEQHQVDWLGKYKNNVGLADLGTSGPYGLYSTIGARWYFGGYGRAH